MREVEEPWPRTDGSPGLEGGREGGRGPQPHLYPLCLTSGPPDSAPVRLRSMAVPSWRVCQSGLGTSWVEVLDTGLLFLLEGFPVSRDCPYLAQ